VKLFDRREVREARAYALSGGQALHVYKSTSVPSEIRRKAPLVFQRSGDWAHLLDQDRTRLIHTAHRLGVRTIRIDCEGYPNQHIDLCGKPLARAIAETTERTP
jgi:hypothetical protein